MVALIADAQTARHQVASQPPLYHPPKGETSDSPHLGGVPPSPEEGWAEAPQYQSEQPVSKVFSVRYFILSTCVIRRFSCSVSVQVMNFPIGFAGFRKDKSLILHDFLRLSDSFYNFLLYLCKRKYKMKVEEVSPFPIAAGATVEGSTIVVSIVPMVPMSSLTHNL